MSDPTRFADDHPSELARSLLAAGLNDEPPKTLLERTLVPLGVGAAATLVSEAAHATTVAGVATTAPPAVAVGSTVFATTVKWVGIAGIGAGLGGVFVGAASGLALLQAPAAKPATTLQAPSHVASPQPAVQQIPAKSAELAPRREAAPDNAAPTPEATPNGLTRVPARVRDANPALETSQQTADVEATRQRALLAEEARSIDEARDAVANGDSARALRALAVHRQKFDQPLLKQEALFLEMRALAAQGDEARAARVATELLKRFPNGPQAAAARAVLRAEEP